MIYCVIQWELLVHNKIYGYHKGEMMFIEKKVSERIINNSVHSVVHLNSRSTTDQNQLMNHWTGKYSVYSKIAITASDTTDIVQFQW